MPTYDTAGISEITTPINMKFQDNMCTTKIATMAMAMADGRPLEDG